MNYVNGIYMEYVDVNYIGTLFSLLIFWSRCPTTKMYLFIQIILILVYIVTLIIQTEIDQSASVSFHSARNFIIKKHYFRRSFFYLETHHRTWLNLSSLAFSYDIKKYSAPVEYTANNCQTTRVNTPVCNFLISTNF